MVRVLWQRIGANAQTGAWPQRCKEVAASKKTGHGLADHRRRRSVHLGMGAQPVALQHEGLRFRVFQRATRGLTYATPDRVFLDDVQGRTMPELARDLVATMQDGDILYGGRWEREKRLLGFSGAQPTAELARRWRFPDSIVRALETAEDPVAAMPFCRLGGIVHVAMLLAEIGLEEPKSPADTIASLPEEIKRALQLDSAWLAEHLPPVADFVDVSVR